MNIEDLKLKPEVAKFSLDSEDIIAAYGEAIDFYMYDHFSLTRYFDFFRAQNEGDTSKLSELVKDMILDVKGKPILDKHHELPIDIFTAAIIKISDHLGKSATKNSTQKGTGTPQ
jgi:hypothetical protein